MHSKDIYAEIFEHHPAEMVIVDKDGVVVAVNAAKRNVRSRKLEKGMNMYVDYASEHIVDMRKELMDCIKKGDLRNFDEMPYRDAILRITIKSFGENRGAIIVSEDITEQMKTQQDLKRRESQLSALVESANDAIVMVDCFGKVSLWNSAAIRIFGYHEKEAVGIPLCDLIIPETDRGECVTLLQDYMANGKKKIPSETIERSVRRKNGELVDVQISLSRIERECGWFTVLIFRDVTEKREEENALRESRELFRHMAITDSLTDLYNRLHFTDELRQEIARAHRYKQPLSIILFDVDDFKKVNDQHGHDRGDEVLRSIARVIQKNVRQHDIPCRYGGEEFAVLLPMTIKRIAHTIAERMRKTIDALQFDFMGENVTISAGVTELQRDDDFNSLVKRADDLMYNAKHNGKNSVAVE